MKLIKIGLASLNQTPLDWRGNSQRIRDAIQKAREEKVQFLGLPELALSGYGCEDAFLSPEVAEDAMETLQSLIPHSSGLIVNVGLPFRFKGVLFNGIAVLCDGHFVGLVPKKILAGDGVHYEQRWFKEWPQGHTDLFPFKIGSEEFMVPMGDLFFQWNDVRFGYEICEEAWVAKRPGARLAEQSIDLIINPSASHFAFGKNEVRKRFVLEGSRAFACVYVYSNLIGNESGRIIFDGSLFMASNGEMVTEGDRFSFHDVNLVTSVIDLEVNRTRRAQSASFKPALEEGTLRGIPIASQKILPCQEEISLKKDTLSSIAMSKNEEFLRAVSLGLFDYLRKSHSSGFAISLSGGIDSSVVAVLAVSALQLAIQELGLSGIKQKLSYISTIQNESSEIELVQKLIHCVYQSTHNSSEATRSAALNLAGGLGVTYSEWSVEPMRALYESNLETALGRPLSWSTDDLALQNIQARVRAPGIWLLANLKNFLLLATCNRSEAAVGYATMDGDTAGGLSPIAGVDKAFLSEWVRWRADHSVGNLPPLPELQKVSQIPPTAELRPPQFKQTDENDLMPYPILDFIERHLLVERIRPRHIFSFLIRQFPHYSQSELRAWLIRFLKLWTQNQWKRERLAPSFHLDSESLDPKTWCRFPILSKAYENDIEELNALNLNE